MEGSGHQTRSLEVTGGRTLLAHRLKPMCQKRTSPCHPEKGGRGRLLLGKRAPTLEGGCKHQWVMGESGACILPPGRSRREEGFGGSEELAKERCYSSALAAISSSIAWSSARKPSVMRLRPR